LLEPSEARRTLEIVFADPGLTGSVPGVSWPRCPPFHLQPEEAAALDCAPDLSNLVECFAALSAGDRHIFRHPGTHAIGTDVAER
jgi:hypothetical protein